MFICDKNYDCCDYKYADKLSDVEEEGRTCGHLIEVTPIKHGHWICENEYNLPKCSVCGKRSHSAEWADEDVFCGHCGAKMDEVK